MFSFVKGFRPVGQLAGGVNYDLQQHHPLTIPLRPFPRKNIKIYCAFLAVE